MDSMGRYLDQVEAVLREYPDQREGQAYYNALRMIWPELQGKIVGTQRDCFSNDRNLPAFLDWVEHVLTDDSDAANRRHPIS